MATLSQVELHKALYELITGVTLTNNAKITIYDVKDEPCLPMTPTVFMVDGILYAVAIQEELDRFLPLHLFTITTEVMLSQVIDRVAVMMGKPMPFISVRCYALYTGEGKPENNTLRLSDVTARIPGDEELGVFEVVVKVIDTDFHCNSPAPSLSEGFWDCNCEESHFCPNSLNECLDCGAKREDMPNSRKNELYDYLISKIEAFRNTGITI